MTHVRILNLAYFKALDIWEKEEKIAKSLPDNKFAQERAKKAWNEVNEISNLLYEEEHKYD